MRPHDSIIVDRADDPAFASVVSAAVIMYLNAWGEAKTLDKTLAVEERIEVNPDMAVRRPRTAGRNHIGPLIAYILVGRLQMFAKRGARIEWL
jgi:hypothetical protein